MPLNQRRLSSPRSPAGKPDRRAPRTGQVLVQRSPNRGVVQEADFARQAWSQRTRSTENMCSCPRRGKSARIPSPSGCIASNWLAGQPRRPRLCAVAAPQSRGGVQVTLRPRRTKSANGCCARSPMGREHRSSRFSSEPSLRWRVAPVFFEGKVEPAVRRWMRALAVLFQVSPRFDIAGPDRPWRRRYARDVDAIRWHSPVCPVVNGPSSSVGDATPGGPVAAAASA